MSVCVTSDSMKISRTRRRPWRALVSIRNARRSLAGKLMVVMLYNHGHRAGGGRRRAAVHRPARQPRGLGRRPAHRGRHSVAGRHTRAVVQRSRIRAAQPRRACRRATRFAPRRSTRPTAALFAQYARAGLPAPPRTVPRLLRGDGVHIDGERVLVVKPVAQGGEVLGTIYLRAHYDVQRPRASPIFRCSAR